MIGDMFIGYSAEEHRRKMEERNWRYPSEPVPPPMTHLMNRVTELEAGLSKACARCGSQCNCTDTVVVRNHKDYASGYIFCCPTCKDTLLAAEITIVEKKPEPVEEKA